MSSDIQVHQTRGDTKGPVRAGPARGRAHLGHRLAPYGFISPFYILFAIFLFLPIVFGAYLSFTEWAGFGTPEVVGIANYQRLFGDSQFYLSLANTLFFVLVSMLVVVPLALLIAQRSTPAACVAATCSGSCTSPRSCCPRSSSC